MNTFTKTLALALTVFGFSTDSFAQVSATSTASALIVTPITITKQVDMNFGNIAVSATGGTVVLAPAGTRTTTGGVVLPTTATGTVTAASFDITGQANYTYAITLPSAATTLTRNSGVETMSVSTFTSSPSLTGTLSGAGAQTITVGATLTVGNSQAAGTYLSGTPFTVTVNYN